MEISPISPISVLFFVSSCLRGCDDTSAHAGRTNIMTTELKGRDFITTQDWTVEELETVIALAEQLKLARATGRPPPGGSHSV